MSVRGTVKAIQKIMRQDVGIDGDAQRISQLCWMFFLKIIDDQDEQLALLDPAYESPIPAELRWRAWAADPEGLTGEALLTFVDDELFPRLKESGQGGSSRERVVRGVFEDAYNYMRSGQLLRQVINKVDTIDFNDLAERQHFGDVYEQLLNTLQSAGNSGEYYTPRAVTQFMADRIDARPSEVILDPACGTGGFLTAAIDRMRANHVKTIQDEESMQACLRGVEKKQLPHMLCVTNMLLHGIEDPSFIRHDNTLARPYISYGTGDRVDVVLSNPPFGGMEEPGIESNFPRQFQTRETADLFLALIIRLLKPGGRAAVVLPDGLLYGEGVKRRLKEQLLEECNLHTIVRLPNSVFKPYAGIGTNLLFFEKGEPTQEVWFYEHTVPEGQKAYSMTRPIRLEHLSECVEWWGGPDRSRRVATGRAWRVELAEIKERGFNLDLDNPNIQPDQYEDPVELVAEIEVSETTLDRVRKEIKASLLAAGVEGSSHLIGEFGRLTASVDSVERLRRFVVGMGLAGALSGDSEGATVDRTARAEEIAAGVDALLETRPRYRRTKAPKEDPRAGEEAPRPGWHPGFIFETGLYVNGRSFKDDEIDTRGLPIIRIQNLSGFNNEFNHAVGEFPEDNLVGAGDLLVSWSATLDAYVWGGPDGVLNQHIFKVVPNLAAVRPEYLFWLLKREVRALADSQHAHGLGMMHINRKPFLSHPIWIPPLAEQERIVAKIDHFMTFFDELVTALEVVGERRERLSASVLHAGI